jgi:hypothetical protein
MQIASGEFASCPKSALGKEHDLATGWIVVRHDHVPLMADRRKLYGKWVAIKSTNKTIYRIIRFSPNIKSTDIVVDWGGWINLQGQKEHLDDNVYLYIRKITFFEKCILPFRYMDHGIVLASYLALASIILSIFLFFISLFR